MMLSTPRLISRSIRSASLTVQTCTSWPARWAARIGSSDRLSARTLSAKSPSRPTSLRVMATISPVLSRPWTANRRHEAPVTSTKTAA